MSIGTCKIELLDPSWVTSGESGSVEVIEKVASGAARVTFSSPGPFIHLKHLDDQPPLKWAKNRRCADAAILTQNEDDLCLHVVELKSKLTTKSWLIVKQQLSGMIANAIAMLAVSGGPKPKRIVCHVSFTEDMIGSSSTPDLVLLKVATGNFNPIGLTEDWTSGVLELFGHQDIPLRKIPRDLATGEGIGDLACIDLPNHHIQ